MPKDINGIKLKRKDIISFVHSDFTGSVLHTEVKEGIILGINNKHGCLKVKDAEKKKYRIAHSKESVTLIERRKREVLIEKI